jgi:hypothetical protein
MTEYLPRNKIYTGTKHKIVNLFVRANSFTKDEIYNIMLKVAQKSFKELKNV